MTTYLVPLIIIGGKVFGWFTATESACIAVLYAGFLSLVVYREMGLKQFWEALGETGRLAGVALTGAALAACTTSPGPGPTASPGAPDDPDLKLRAEVAEDEAALVRDAIRERLARGRRLHDFAVFYRTNAQSRAFEEALGRARLPHRLVGAVQFYARQEIKDFLAFLRILVNERDDLSLQRILNVPPRGLGGTSVERTKAWALEQGIPLRAALARAAEVPDLGTRAHKAAAAFLALVAECQQALGRPVAELAALVLAKTGYEKWLRQPENEERHENVKEFLNRAALYDGQHPDGSLESFLQEIALVSDVDNLDERADAVTLMTLHAAKGLEFPVVFLTGFEEGLLPHANAIRPADSGWGEDAQKVEEERRLCYVGMTRAQEELLLTAASDRMQFQSASQGSPSRFLSELSPKVFDAESRAALAAAKAEGVER